MTHPRSPERTAKSDTIYLIVADNARRARERAGMTRAEVSAVLGAGESYYRGVETCHKHISLLRLVEIADALGVTAGELLEGV